MVYSTFQLTFFNVFNNWSFEDFKNVFEQLKRIKKKKKKFDSLIHIYSIIKYHLLKQNYKPRNFIAALETKLKKLKNSTHSLFGVGCGNCHLPRAVHYKRGCERKRDAHRFAVKWFPQYSHNVEFSFLPFNK